MKPAGDIIQLWNDRINLGINEKEIEWIEILDVK